MVYLIILIAAIVQAILGSIWYGPLFGDTWMKLSKIKKPKKMTAEIKKQMFFSYSWMFVGSIITAFILDLLIIGLDFMNTFNLVFGIVLLWLGFVAPVQLGMVLWEGKPVKLYLINISYYLVSLIVTGLILYKFN